MKPAATQLGRTRPSRASCACALALCVACDHRPVSGGKPLSLANASARIKDMYTIPSNTTSPWSHTDNLLRGRLVADQTSVDTSGHLQLEVEFENVGAPPLTVQLSNPLAYSIVVREAAGGEVRPTFQRGDVLASARWDVLEQGKPRRFPLSIRGQEDGAADAQLDVTTSAWRLAPGSYRVSGSFASERFSGDSRPTAWRGNLELPAVELHVSP
jgi:hypothetical protein